MIRRVLLRNWKSHLESSFEFSKGVNIILGINGSGKSSVFDAICFGLYGTTPDLQSKKIKLEDLVMKKPYQRNEAEVVVEFENDGNIYIVRRIIKAGRSTAELRENNKLVELQSSQRVNEIIEEKLKTNLDLFTKIIYSKQNSLDYFLNLSPSERKKKIDEILMLENFEKARTSCNSLITRIQDRILEKENFVRAFDEESVRKQKDEIEKEIKEIEEWISPLKNQLVEISTRRISLEEEYSKNKKVREELEKMKREQASTSSLISQLKKDLEKLEEECKGLDRISAIKDLEKIKKDYKDLEKYVSELKNNIEKRINKKSEILSSINFLDKKIEEVEKSLKEIEIIEKEISEIEKGASQRILEEEEKFLINLKSKALSIEKEIESIQDNIKILEDAESRCPVCGSKLSEEKKENLIKKKKEEIKSKTKEVEKIREEINVKSQKIEELRKKVKELEKLKVKVSEKEKLKEDLEIYKSQKIIENDNLKSLEKELEDLKKDLEEKENLFKEYLERKNKLEIAITKLNEYEEKKEKVSRLEKDYSLISSQILALENQISAYPLEKMEKELMQLISKEKEIAIEIKNKEELKKRLLVNLEEIEKRLQAFEKEKKEIEKLRKIVIDLKIFLEALKVTQEKLREEFVQAVNSYMNAIWSELYPYKDFVSIALKIEEGDYVLQLQERSGRWINVEGIVSGGERSLAALALRIAFSLTLAPQLKVLILDEPTHNLDANSVEELARVLRERISEFLDQVFIITHDERLESAVTGKIYKLERDKENDGFTKVTEI